MATKATDWSNTVWGKLTMVGLTAVVVQLSNGIFSSVNNLSQYPKLVKDVAFLMNEHELSNQKYNYDSVRTVALELYKKGEAQRKREDDSLRRIDALEYYDGLQNKYKDYLPKKGKQRAGTTERQRGG